MADIDQMLPELKVFENYGHQNHVLKNGKICDYSPYEAIFEKAKKMKKLKENNGKDEIWKK